MVTSVVSIKVSDNGTYAWLKNLPKRTRRIGNFHAWNLTQTGARLLKESAIRAGITDWHGELLSGIKAEKESLGTYRIWMPLYGLALDRMKKHRVYLRGRILEWAKDKLPEIYSRRITVRPHPFIERGYKQMLDVLEMRVARIANQIVR